MRLSWTVSTALAISTSLRAATSGSAKPLDSTNFMRRPDLPCRHRAPRSSTYRPAAVAAMPSLHPTVPVAKRRALHRSSRSPASPSGGLARPPRSVRSSGSRRQDGPAVAGGGRVVKYGPLVADGPKQPSSCPLPRDPVSEDCLSEVDDRSTTHFSLHRPWVLNPRTCEGSVRVMPRRRPEKVVNKVADNSSNLRLRALPVGLGAFITRPGEGCDGQTEALAGRP